MPGRTSRLHSAAGHLLEFDAERGLIRCEAGITLDALIAFIAPHGFFLPVTPGTKFPTIGGCVAADVHGKNHHKEGSIGVFVEEIELFLADRSRVCCSREERTELFWATIGGMGLTGAIYAVTLRLKKVENTYMRTHAQTRNFDELCRHFEETQQDYTYSVAWIDSLANGAHLGRGSLILGEHATADQAPTSKRFKLHSTGGPSVPFFPAPYSTV